MPPNMLKAKVGGSIGGIDMAAVKRAEAAMEVLKIEFHDWIGDDVAQAGRRARAFAQSPDAGGRADLFRAGTRPQGPGADVRAIR